MPGDEAMTHLSARGIPVLSAGPIGMSTSMLLFTPKSMAFDAYYDLNDRQGHLEQLAGFMVGTAPALSQRRYLDASGINLRTGATPSLGAACCLSAGVVGIETLRVLLDRPGLKPAPHYYQFDAYRRRFYSGRLLFGNRGPLQRLKRRQVAAWLRQRWERDHTDKGSRHPLHAVARRNDHASDAKTATAAPR